MTTTITATTPTSATTADGCTCDEGRAAGLTRRSLLSRLGGLGAAGAVAGLLGESSASQFAFAGPGYAGDTVVVLSLRGGFDGLSAVIPVGDPAYAAARPTIAVPESRAIKLTSMFGLHPALSALKPLWDRKQLAAVHAVGQPNPTRSHFASMEAMENAAPGSSLRTGWIDRMIGLDTGSTFAAAAVGSSTAPSSMIGPHPEITLRTVDGFQLSGAWDATELNRWRTALGALHAKAPASVAVPADTALDALSTTAKLKTAGYVPANGAKYPDTELGDALADVARLIKAGVGLRAATVDVGNWDMHSGLGKSDAGWMFRQLTDLGNALAAFATDLGNKLNDVTLVTLSEFGRRVAENSSGGLDHGHGNVCLLLGGGVVGGQVYGTWPGLASAKLDNGDLAGTTDYRTILAEVLEKRGQLNVSTVFPKLASKRLGALKPRS